VSRGFNKVSFAQFMKDCFTWGSPEGIRDLYDAIVLPRRATVGSAGYDICSPFCFNLPVGKTVILPTGIKVFMCRDEMVDIRVRSSVGIKSGIMILNALPLIDADYFGNPKNEGHIFLALKNTGDIEWPVVSGQAIAQATFQKYLVTDDDDPISKDRLGGIGSTNKT